MNGRSDRQLSIHDLLNSGSMSHHILGSRNCKRSVIAKHSLCNVLYLSATSLRVTKLVNVFLSVGCTDLCAGTVPHKSLSLELLLIFKFNAN